MADLAKKVDHLVSEILLKAENQHELLFGDCQSGVNLTNTQEHILMLLSQERLTNSELAKQLNVSQAAVTKAVKGLIAQDLLVSVKDTKDARISYFDLSDLAKSIADEHLHHHHATLGVYDDLVEQFSTEDQAVIDHFLEVFINRLER